MCLELILFSCFQIKLIGGGTGWGSYDLIGVSIKKQGLGRVAIG